MTDTEANSAVAQECGWTRGRNGNYGDMWVNPAGTPIGFIPYYGADLNAMHEAEKTLRELEHPAPHEPSLGKLRWHLSQIVGNQYAICHATAAQRREAFLRVKGLWKD